MNEWEVKNYSQRTVNFMVDMGGRICRDLQLFAQPVKNRIAAIKNGLQHGFSPMLAEEYILIKQYYHQLRSGLNE